MRSSEKSWFRNCFWTSFASAWFYTYYFGIIYKFRHTKIPQYPQYKKWDIEKKIKWKKSNDALYFLVLQEKCLVKILSKFLSQNIRKIQNETSRKRKSEKKNTPEEKEFLVNHLSCIRKELSCNVWQLSTKISTLYIFSTSICKTFSKNYHAHELCINSIWFLPLC